MKFTLRTFILYTAGTHFLIDEYVQMKLCGVSWNRSRLLTNPAHVLTMIFSGSQPSKGMMICCFTILHELCSRAKMLLCCEEEFDVGGSVDMGDGEGASELGGVVAGLYIIGDDSSLSLTCTIAAVCTALSSNAVDSATCNSIFMTEYASITAAFEICFKCPG